METIEHLRKISKFKLIIMSISTLLPIGILICMELWNKNGIFHEGMSAIPDLVIFRYGIFVLFEIYIGSKIYSYAKILSNIDYAQNALVTKNDERIKFIKLKTNSMTIKIEIYAIGLAMIIGAFFNRIVFYSMFGVCVGLVIIYFSCRLYYIKKY